MLFLWLVLLLVGFVFLIKGADVFVDGASALAKNFGISALVIGLTIVAMGTSLPELMVSVASSLQGANGMSFGNVVGSNIFNTLVILGVCALLLPLTVKKTTVYKEIPFLAMVTLITGIFAFDNIFHQRGDAVVLGRADGFVLLLLFVVFLYYLFGLMSSSKKMKEEIDDEVSEMKVMTRGKSAALIGGGLLGVIGGGALVVKGAAETALLVGMSETMVGLTVIALGTSLPELVTSIVAVRKGHTDMAVGNVVGSNVFNLLFVLGLSAVVSPLGLDANLAVDMAFLIIMTLLLWVLVMTGRKLSKVEGVLFLILYAGYLTYVIGRNYLGW